MSARRSRREFLVGLSATVGALSLAGCSPFSDDSDDTTSRSPDRRPNVLYITADDMGTHLGAYGHPHAITPRLDRFAAEATLFERAYCQIALCAPSRTSILTGIRPETSGIVELEHDWRSILPDAASLVRTFAASGYRTYGVGKINDTRGGALEDDAWLTAPPKRGLRDPAPALELLDRVAESRDTPFFLAAGFTAPHCPWNPSQESLDQYDAATVRPDGPARRFRRSQVESCELPEGTHIPNLMNPAFPSVEYTDQQLAGFARDYLASVTDLDSFFGQIMDTADALGLVENTIVIFWSGDHGYSLGLNGRWGKWSNYDAATRIPLIMRVPGRGTPGSRVPRLVEAVDMFPTLVELCDLEPPPQDLEGLSFAPLFDDPTRGWKSGAFSIWASETRNDRSIKTETHNLIVNDERDELELYDLIADPKETTNIAEAQPELAAQLQAMLDAGPSAALPAPAPA